jgi:hypothetical protein
MRSSRFWFFGTADLQVMYRPVGGKLDAGLRLSSPGADRPFALPLICRRDPEVVIPVMVPTFAVCKGTFSSGIKMGEGFKVRSSCTCHPNQINTRDSAVEESGHVEPGETDP